MSEGWYYVVGGQRQGPVELGVVKDLISSGQLNDDDYVWCKHFENWTKIQDTRELSGSMPEEGSETSPNNSSVITYEEIRLSDLDKEAKVIFIKTGSDRGTDETEYGPFSLDILAKLFTENRINEKTFIFTKGMANWKVLGDLEDFKVLFNCEPPPIEDTDRRAFIRKPFIARMFVQNKQEVFEGICRDVSVGGMQVLMSNFEVEAGDKISINVHPENTDHNFVASGEVVRLLEGGQGFSFRFINLGDDAIRAINSYINFE